MDLLNTLIIDDNRRYTKMLRERLEQASCKVEHVLSSRESLSLLKKTDPNNYRLIVSDITMESQVSGIFLVMKIRRMGYHGGLVIYSTGFNFLLVNLISRPFFRLLGVDGLIAKKGLKNDQPKLIKLSDHPALDTLISAFS